MKRITRIIAMLLLPVAIMGLVDAGRGAAQKASPDIAPPSNLRIVPLDSSLHVNFTPSSDSSTAFHVVSVWQDGGSTLQQAKVVGRTATAAQTNGLMPDTTYTVRVQAMDSTGNLSDPVESVATTDPQLYMPNVAFFDNFNSPSGDLNPDLYDVRTSHGAGLRPTDLGDLRYMAFVNENHFHTQMIGSFQRGELYIRPRMPFDFKGRTGTFQVEVDDAPVQHGGGGKWWEIHLVKDLPWSSEEFGAGRGDDFPNSLEFSLRASRSVSNGEVNLPVISVNINGTTKDYIGQASRFSSTNIRMPLVLHVSQTSAVMEINGTPVVTATGFTLPFTTGHWILAHRQWYAGRDTTTSPQTIQLVHWETIQFDGQPDAATTNPTIKTYIQPGCGGVVHNESGHIEGCLRMDFSNHRPQYSVPFLIRDDLSHAKWVQMVFNGYSDNGHLSANINGHVVNLPVKRCDSPEGYCQTSVINTYTFPGDWLRPLTTVVLETVPGNDAEISQVELETVFDTPRQLNEGMSMGPLPMLSVTNMNFRIDRLVTDPQVMTATTNVYAIGGVTPLPFTATVVTRSPWLAVSPAQGVLDSPALGGGVTPLTLKVDFSNLAADDDGEVGVVKIQGGTMPTYVAVMAVNDGETSRPHYMTTFPVTTNFNRDAIPGYGR